MPDQPGDDHADRYLTAYRLAKAKVAVEILLASPEWAQDVLDRQNSRNRRLSEHLARRLRDIITGGRWQLNGEAVVFDYNGKLLDGQHRLKAIVMAGIAVPVLVVRGVDPDAFSTFDQGKLRNRSDVLSVPLAEGSEREKNTVTLASALAHVYRWANGCMDLIHRVPDNSEIVALLDKHPGIRESVVESIARSKKNIHSPSLFAALHYLFGLKDPALAASFFEKVWDHTGVVKGSNEAALNQWLDNRKARATASDVVITAAVVIKCWNRVREGLPAPAAFMFRDNERFPEIK